MDLNAFRQKYPAYKNWSDTKLSSAIERKHEAEGIPEDEKGWAGIGNDIANSWESAPNALAQMIESIPGGIKNVAKYATSNNPASTLANIGAGGVESGAGVLSAPQMLVRYLSQKFPQLGKQDQKNDPTFYEGLMDFEKQHGLAPQSEEEASVRNAGGLLFGGKLLSKLPGMLSRSTAITGESSGRGGDPIHAAILSMAGDLTSRAPWKKVADIPQSTAEAVKKLPELAGQTAATGLETVADLGTKAHIPGLQPTLGALGSYLKYISVKPEELARRKLFGDIAPEDVPQINERTEAAKRLGLGYLTPAEATLSPFEAAKQGTIGRTSAGSKLLFEKGKERTSSEATAINNLLDTIYDDSELSPKKKAAYEETMKSSVPPEFIEKHSDDPVIQSAMEQLHKDPVYRKALGIDKKSAEEGIVPKDTFEYWDHIKRILGDMEEGNASGEGRRPYKKSVIASTRRDMVSDMDKIEPKYEVARGIAERQFTRKNLEDVFDKKTMTGNNFYKFLQSKKNFNETMNKLKAFPEAQQKLKDMHLLFGDLIPNDMSIRSAAALKRTSMSEARNKLDALKQELDERYGKKHDVAAVKLMTDPDWLNQLSEHLKNKTRSK